jgi:hypothetical protein
MALKKLRPVYGKGRPSRRKLVPEMVSSFLAEGGCGPWVGAVVRAAEVRCEARSAVKNEVRRKFIT